MRSLWGKLAALILVLGIFGIGITYFNMSNVNVPQKPLVRESAPKDEPPILKEASRYANSISRLDFKTAKAMSSPKNIDLLDSLIIPKLSEWEQKISGTGLKFKTVFFENAMLVNDNLNDLIVTESLNLERPFDGIAGFYLKFRIKKDGKIFEVEDTELMEKPNLAWGFKKSPSRLTEQQ